MIGRFLNGMAILFVLVGGVAMLSLLRHQSLEPQLGTQAMILLAKQVVSDLGMKPSGSPRIIEKAFYVNVVQDMNLPPEIPPGVDQATRNLVDAGFQPSPRKGLYTKTLCKGETTVQMDLSPPRAGSGRPRVSVTWGNGLAACGY